MTASETHRVGKTIGDPIEHLDATGIGGPLTLREQALSDFLAGAAIFTVLALLAVTVLAYASRVL